MNKEEQETVEFEDGSIYEVGEKIRQRSLSEMFWNMVIIDAHDMTDHINGCEAVELNGDRHEGLVYFMVNGDVGAVRPKMILNKESRTLFVYNAVWGYISDKILMRNEDISLEEFIKGEIKKYYGFDDIDQVKPSPDQSIYPEMMPYITVGAYERLKN